MLSDGGNPGFRRDGCVGAPEWKPLFNGKDFAGFYTHVEGQGRNKDPKGYFSVQDSSIRTYANLIEGESVTFGYVVTKKEYCHFRLRFQFKWGTKRFAPRAAVKRDAGLMFHMGNDELWPRCVQYQIQEGDVGDIWAIRKIWVTTTVDPISIAVATKNPKLMEASAGVFHSHRAGAQKPRGAETRLGTKPVSMPGAG